MPNAYANMALAGPLCIASVVCGLFQFAIAVPEGSPAVWISSLDLEYQKQWRSPHPSSSRLCPVAQIKIDSRSICS